MSGTPTTVLIVDDNRDLRDLLEEVLADAGHRVVMAGDGGEALRLVQAHRPEVVLLDMMMPDVDGLQFLERLPRECGAPLPKVLAYSGFDKFQELALSRGAAGFLRKPIDVEHLLAAIDAVRREPPITLESAGLGARPDGAESERRREALLSAMALDDPRLRRQLRMLVAWAADYFGVAKSVVGVLRNARLIVLSQSGDIDFPEDVPLDPDVAYCPEVVRAESPLVIRDTREDAAFRGHPGAASPYCFYAGAPLLSEAKVSVGAFCVRNVQPFDFHAEDMALLSYFARWVGRDMGRLAEHEAPIPLFCARRVFSAEPLVVLIDAELRRSERDRESTSLLLVEGEWGDSLTDAVLKVARQRRIALAHLGDDLTAVLLGSAEVAHAAERADAILSALPLDDASRAAGLVRFDGYHHRLFDAGFFLQTAKSAYRDATLKRGSEPVQRRVL